MKTKKKKLKDACWDGYEAYGTKMKNGKKVPNCVPESLEKEINKELDSLIEETKRKKKRERKKLHQPSMYRSSAQADLSAKCDKKIVEALPAPVRAEVNLASKHSGTKDATKVDWKSGKGPQTDLGKRAQRKKRKKEYKPRFKVNPRGFGEVARQHG